jgi:hypothetical protein
MDTGTAGPTSLATAIGDRTFRICNANTTNLNDDDEYAIHYVAYAEL